MTELYRIRALGLSLLNYWVSKKKNPTLNENSKFGSNFAHEPFLGESWANLPKSRDDNTEAMATPS
jgi:hypothetical protein